MKPTPEQVQQELKWLVDNKSKVTRHSYFGDDHHAAIDAQIEVLEKEMDEDAVYERWPTTADEDGRTTSSPSTCAREAAMWLAGDKENPSSSEWKSLIK